MFFKASSPDGAWSWDTFISPFSKKTWIVTIANIIASSVVLFITHYFRVSRRHKKRTTARGDCKKEDEQFNFVNSIFTAFSAQVQQGKIIRYRFDKLNQFYLISFNYIIYILNQTKQIDH